MKKEKILIGINIILLFFLIMCVFFLAKREREKEKDNVKEIAIGLLDEMIKETHEGFSEHFKYYEMRSSFIKEDLDSFYVLMNQGVCSSAQFFNYYDKTVSKDSQESKIIFNMLCSIKNKQSQDFILISKFIEYRFIKKIIENHGYLSFFWLDGLGVNVCSKKDTIQIGEEYIAEITYSGSIMNKEQQSIVVINEDTLNADCGYYRFKERAKKRGLVQHKGYMTYFHPDAGILKFPLEFEYYVK
jgi:hypothetical protein